MSGIIGDLLDTKTYTWTDGDATHYDGNPRVVKPFIPLTLSATNTYVLLWNFWVSMNMFGGASSSERRAYINVRMTDSNPGSAETIFTGGTVFIQGLVGRVLVSVTSTNCGGYHQYSSRSVVPYGTSGLKYFGITLNSDGGTWGSNGNSTTAYASGNNHMNFIFQEYKGDIDDRTT